MKAVQLMLVPEAACPCGKHRKRSRRYGVPYVGSKNRIAREIVDLLPPAKHFYDLFAGGCAVAHAALESGKWETVHVNDIDPMGIDLFMGAVRGNYRNERRVIDRETFERLKGVDPYVRYCWSFGANGDAYLWNGETEGAKLLASRMVFSTSWSERLRLYQQFIQYLRRKKNELAERRERRNEYAAEIGSIEEHLRGELRKALAESGRRPTDVDRHLGTNGMAGHYFGAVQWEFPTREKYDRLREILPLPEYGFWERELSALQSLDALQGQQRLQTVIGLEDSVDLTRVISTALDYRAVRFEPGAVVYCDIPYRATGVDYGAAFDHEAFYDWAETVPNVWISEYSMPDDRFECVWSRSKTCHYSASSNATKTVERLYRPRRRP